MVIGQSNYSLRISEEREILTQDPTSEEHDQRKTYAWQQTRPTEREVGTGRLVLELPHDWSHSGRRRRWADRARWTLDNKLPDVLSELEERAQLDEERRISTVAEEARRQRDQEAIATAHVHYAEDIKINALIGQVDSWEQEARILRRPPSNPTLHAGNRSRSRRMA